MEENKDQDVLQNRNELKYSKEPKYRNELKYQNELKYRNELKYQCSEQQLRMLEVRIRHLCPPDPHAGADGQYTVRSLYFDDYRNSCYYDNESGVDRREKFRIRFYDGKTDRITLECKQKINGKNHKYTCKISKELCESILSGQFVLPPGADPVLNRFFLRYRAGFYRPKVIVEYERAPFLYRTGNVRITFDRNIAATSRVRDFLKPRLAARPMMPAGMHLLEVKYDELLPDFIYSELQLDNLQLSAYSKYYMARRATGNFCI
ncbi:MAG: polyphosphate polymerase domain-containing protein [Muribaculum sp.]|nr:polyphosphate polymerase domain-containing protein [Muribaculum sp.]